MKPDSVKIFEIGRNYKIRIIRDLGDHEEVLPCIVIGFEFPLIRVTSNFGNFVFNTTSPYFVSAELDE